MFIHHRNYRPFDYLSLFVIDQPIIGRFFMTDTFGIEATIMIYQEKDSGPTTIFKNLNEAADHLAIRSNTTKEGYIPIFDSTGNSMFADLLSKKMAGMGRKVLEVTGGRVRDVNTVFENTIINVQYYPGLLNNADYKIGFQPGRKLLSSVARPIQSCSITDQYNAYDEITYRNTVLSTHTDKIQTQSNIATIIENSLNAHSSIFIKHSDDDLTTFLKGHASNIKHPCISFGLKPAISTMN